MITTEAQVVEIEEFLKSIALSVQVLEGIDLHFVLGWRYVKEDVNLCSCMFQLSHTYKLSGVRGSTHTIGFFRIVIEKGFARAIVSELRDEPGMEKKVYSVDEVKEFFSEKMDDAIRELKSKKE